ncbi:MAG: organic solvent tolerance protein OstA [Spirochaetaceae bacterium]|nr:organic solvent tolerance protein OstA [Spirochaetaceae bacterium]MDT8299773.1 organic solvent tolerance protein OstA [Spirochaetaceae bacterium]
MIRTSASLVFLLSFLLFFSWPVKLRAETWRFAADQVSSTQGDQRNRTILDGNARVESDSMEIEALHIELGGEDFSLISGTGGILLNDKDKGLTVEARRFEYDRKAKIIRFREQVTLVDESEGIVIRCESLDLFEEEDLAVMQVSVRLIKEKTVCRGEFATFRRDVNILEISGRPVVWREDDEYRAQRITVNLDTDEIVMEGAVEGALTTQDTEDG